MEAQQSINFIFADIKLGNHRVCRGNLSHQQLIETGEEDSYIRTALAWFKLRIYIHLI